jgi:hypothetical protein
MVKMNEHIQQEKEGKEMKLFRTGVGGARGEERPTKKG